MECRAYCRKQKVGKNSSGSGMKQKHHCNHGDAGGDKSGKNQDGSQFGITTVSFGKNRRHGSRWHGRFQHHNLVPQFRKLEPPRLKV